MSDKSPYQETTNKGVTTHTPCDFVFLTYRHQENLVDGELSTNSYQTFYNMHEQHLQCLWNGQGQMMHSHYYIRYPTVYEFLHRQHKSAGKSGLNSIHYIHDRQKYREEVFDK